MCVFIFSTRFHLKVVPHSLKVVQWNFMLIQLQNELLIFEYVGGIFLHFIAIRFSFLIRSTHRKSFVKNSLRRFSSDFYHPIYIEFFFDDNMKFVNYIFHLFFPFVSNIFSFIILDPNIDEKLSTKIKLLI